MLEILKYNKNNKKLTAIKYEYVNEALFFYVLDFNEYFHFVVEEYDFRLEGYQIRLNGDITNLKTINNFSSKINEYEKLPEQIENFNISLNTYKDMFNDLMKLNKVISIEREYFDDDYFFLIGKIEEVLDEGIMFKDFDIDGNWNLEYSFIPYDIITTIRFNSNYTNVWEKYLK